jgi:hypothetical protein
MISYCDFIIVDVAVVDVIISNSSSVKENMRLMKTLDDAWNFQDWDTFSKRHADNVVVRWPGGQPSTNGIDAHLSLRCIFCHKGLGHSQNENSANISETFLHHCVITLTILDRTFLC